VDYAEIEVSRFYCGTIRDYLNRKKMFCPSLQWYEGNGMFYRTFTVRGEAIAIRDFKAFIEFLRK